jgi:hypothetical protein
LSFEPVSVVPVNFGVCSGPIAALEFRIRVCYFIFPVSYGVRYAHFPIHRSYWAGPNVNRYSRLGYKGG